jgi:hypothetical protein
MQLSLFTEGGRAANATRKGGKFAPVTVSVFMAIGGVTKVDTSSGSVEGSNHFCCLLQSILIHRRVCDCRSHKPLRLYVGRLDVSHGCALKSRVKVLCSRHFTS